MDIFYYRLMIKEKMKESFCKCSKKNWKKAKDAIDLVRK
jgi:hypothetical protein